MRLGPCPRRMPLCQAVTPPAHIGPREYVPGCHVLPFLQDSDKLGEPVTLHFRSLPEGLELCHLCLPAFLFGGVREPGDQGGGRGQRSFEGLSEDIHLPVMVGGIERTFRDPQRQPQRRKPTQSFLALLVLLLWLLLSPPFLCLLKSLNLT